MATIVQDLLVGEAAHETSVDAPDLFLRLSLQSMSNTSRPLAYIRYHCLRVSARSDIDADIETVACVSVKQD